MCKREFPAPGWIIALAMFHALLIGGPWSATAQIPRTVDNLAYSKPADFTTLSWVDAFDALHKKLSTEYAFTSWKRIDWPSLYRTYGERIVDAQRRRDAAAYYLALREYLFSIPDGHVALIGNDKGMMKSQIGGGYGFVATRLDNGQVIAYLVTASGPAEKAGMKPGAVIVTFGGRPVLEAADRISTLWTNSPVSTHAHRRTEQMRYLTRAPIGASAEVTFINPGEGRRTVTLTATDDDRETLRRSSPRKVINQNELVTHKVLPSGIGYIEVFLEMSPVVAQMKAALQDLIDKKVQGILLDIRSNGGGDDQMAADLASFFHEKKSFYEFGQYFNTATGTFDVASSETVYLTPHEPHFDGPVIALIGRGTGSSGEGVAWQIGTAPKGRTMGLEGTFGIFGMSGGQVAMPEGLTVRFPFGTSLDHRYRIQIDSDHTGRGGILPQIRVPHTYETMMAIGQGRDVVLEAAEREMRKALEK